MGVLSGGDLGVRPALAYVFLQLYLYLCYICILCAFLFVFLSGCIMWGPTRCDSGPYVFIPPNVFVFVSLFVFVFEFCICVFVCILFVFVF